MNGLNLIEEERGLETHFKALRYKESVPYLGKRYLHIITNHKHSFAAECGIPQLMGREMTMDLMKMHFENLKVEVEWETFELVDIELIVK